MASETIANIVAEMRKDIPRVVDAKIILRNYADRIEAAHKREATAEKSSAVGNAAAMREALSNSNGLLEELALIGEWEGSAREQIAENNAALAAPLRNCDIYDAESCRMAYHLHGDGLMTMQAFADWLFAPAEGGGEK